MTTVKVGGELLCARSPLHVPVAATEGLLQRSSGRINVLQVGANDGEFGDMTAGQCHDVARRLMHTLRQKQNVHEWLIEPNPPVFK